MSDITIPYWVFLILLVGLGSLIHTIQSFIVTWIKSRKTLKDWKKQREILLDWEPPEEKK